MISKTFRAAAASAVDNMVRRNSQRGFTIIELVVVAAIVGILAAIGVTNYIKFSNRTKQRTAKLYLATAFLAERTFFAEHLSYTYCLRQIHAFPGNPDPAGAAGADRPYYLGFSNGVITPTCGPSGAESCFGFSFAPNFAACSCGAFPPAGSNDCTADSTSSSALAEAALYIWNAQRATFKVGAAGFLGNVQADVWEMDETKKLTQLQNGE